MAVQSPHPSNNLLPDLLRRVRSAEKKSISSSIVNGQVHTEDLQSSPWLHVFKTPITACQQQPMKSKEASGKEVTCKMNKLKRTWEAVFEEPLVANRAASGASGAFTLGTATLGTAPVFTGLRLATSSPMLDNSSPQPSTSGFHAPDFAASFQAHLDKHTTDVFHLINSQADAMKQAIEEKRAMHTQVLLSLVEERVGKRLKIKDEELEKAKMRTMELEEGLKQLSLEAQLWKNLAKNNELMALNLKQNLEQVVAQMREHHHHHQHNHAYHHISREEGCGESEVDDAESCQHVGGEKSFPKECKDLEQRKCKFCRVNDVCVLLLPCRHLCLCLECNGRLDRCPMCGITKNASLQVYT